MKYHRCWCQHTWPVLLGPNCPSCGRMSGLPVFTQEKSDKLRRGTYGGMYIGPMQGAAWETWCAEHGF